MSSLSRAVPAHLFFYGTLVAGNANPVAAAIHAALEPVGPGKVAGSLYAIPDPAGWFPALVAGDGAISGRLYRTGPRFDAALLARMDAYEDFDPNDPAGSLYRRVRMPVTVGAGPIEADAYRWNRSLPPGARAIGSGDFAQWVAATGGAVFGGAHGG